MMVLIKRVHVIANENFLNANPNPTPCRVVVTSACVPTKEVACMSTIKSPPTHEFLDKEVASLANCGLMGIIMVGAQLIPPSLLKIGVQICLYLIGFKTKCVKWYLACK